MYRWEHLHVPRTGEKVVDQTEKPLNITCLYRQIPMGGGFKCPSCSPWNKPCMHMQIYMLCVCVCVCVCVFKLLSLSEFEGRYWAELKGRTQQKQTDNAILVSWSVNVMLQISVMNLLMNTSLIQATILYEQITCTCMECVLLLYQPLLHLWGIDMGLLGWPSPPTHFCLIPISLNSMYMSQDHIL